jgi:uncharacterized protein
MIFQLTKVTLAQLSLGSLLILVACCAEHAAQDTSTQKPESNAVQNDTTQLANPASTNCIEQGGTLKLLEDADGQFGVCIFNDGSRCEEWHLFRKQCTPGTCHELNGICEE